MPSLEINGLWGGYCGSGSKTIIPAEAFAKFTVRTVPYQRHGEICAAVESFIKNCCPPHGQMQLRWSTAGGPYAIDWASSGKKFTELFNLMETALGSEFENAPLRIREGGSIGVVRQFMDALSANSLLLGVVPTLSNIHAPNENWAIETFQRTRRTVAKFLRAIADQR
jgi:acetylornithine deacetylase/succinyl-diaminopimelate desuccinylase-like protein